MVGVKTWLSSQVAVFFDTGIQKLMPHTTGALIPAVTALRNSLSAYVLFLYTKLNSVACSPQANYTDRAAAAR
jgi:hypothetical protein